MRLKELINNPPKGDTKKNKAHLAVLVDPDKFNGRLIELAEKSAVSFFLVGGSTLKKNNLSQTISQIKKRSKKPVIIFPGDETQVSKNADGMLLLSLISGRNPEYLIGKHVKAAKKIAAAQLEVLPTGYILINGDKTSTTQKITKTKTLQSKSLDIIANTALAAQLLGFGAIYLEAGSGAKTAVNAKVIKKVKSVIKLPLFVGGGINSYAKAKIAINSGANVVVIGNSLEKNINLLSEIEKAFL